MSRSFGSPVFRLAFVLLAATPLPAASAPVDFSVGGTLSGLGDSRAVNLRLAYTPACVGKGGKACKVAAPGSETLWRYANGNFSFPTRLEPGDSYTVTVDIQPTDQTCVVTQGDGTTGSADIDSVQVTCTPAILSVGGTVSGLQAGYFVGLSERGVNQGGYRNGPYWFQKPDGSDYDIDINAQPPGHVCTLSGPDSGTLSGANVTGIDITCVPDPISIGGALAGLAGGSNGVTLRMAYQPAVDPCAASSGALTCKVSAAGSEDLVVSNNGSFTFTTPLNIDDTFTVDVAPAGQPTAPAQACTVSNAITKAGGGTVGTSDITYLEVVCAPPAQYTVGGNVSGLLAGYSLTLTQSGGGEQTFGNGSYSFTVTDGSPYAIAIGTQPDGHTCSIGGAASGTVSGANVSGVDVTCTPNNYSIGGTVSGLTSGNAVTLRHSYTPAGPCPAKAAGSDKTCKVAAPGSEDLTVPANGSFTFPTALNIGDGFSVDVAPGGQPTAPNQTCTVTGAINKSSGKAAVGQVFTSNITYIQVLCTTESYSIGGNVVGLAAGNSTVLQINGGETLTVSDNTSFVFPTALADGSSYSVSVITQPTTPNQTCVLSRQAPGKGAGISGVLSGFNVTDLRLACSTNTYTIGGTVTGLVGSGLVLRNNGGDDLPVSANGAFTFATPLADGSHYNVTVATQPASPAQTCSVPQASKGSVLGAGTVNGANVTSIPVTCITDPTAPGAPTNVQVGFNGNLASISWAPPSNDGGSPITGYTVVLQPGGLSCTVSAPATSCQISGVQPGVNYTATVTASNGIGAGAPGTGNGTASPPAPAIIPVDQPWALVLLGLMVMLLGGRGVLARRD